MVPDDDVAVHGESPAAPDALRRRNRELAILNTIAEALNASVDLAGSLERALSLVAETLDLETGWVLLLDEESGEPFLAASQNLPPGLAREPERMTGSCFCLDTFRAGDLDGAANVNVVRCSRLRALVDGTGGLAYHASIPLYAGEKKLGVLNVASPQWRELTPEELRLLHTVGDLLGIAVERARMFERSARAGAAEERNRLAREIHDTLAQALSGIALRLDTAEALLEEARGAGAAREAVSEALAITRSSLEEARRSVLDLRAAPLEGRSLADALAARVDEAGAETDAEVRFEAVGAAAPLPARVEAGIFRIVQEALNNALRHAGADTIVVRLEVLPDRATVTVADDGRGFDAGRIDGERFGLIGLRERARLLDGELAIESEPGAGTRIEATVPLE